eukprot:129805_1
MAAVDWVQIHKATDEWSQCTKCGHRPRGQPAMACSGCKKVHGDFTPNPYGLYLTVAQRRFLWQQALQKQKEAERQLEADNGAQKKALDSLRPQALKVAAAKNAGLLEQREKALKVAIPGPATKARSNAEIGTCLDEVERLAREAVRHGEEKAAAQARHDGLVNERTNLQDGISAAEIELRAMKAEAERLKEALLTRFEAPAAPQPAVAAAPALPQVIYQQQPQQPMVFQQPQPAPFVIQPPPLPPQPIYVMPPAQPAPQPLIISAAR